MAKAKIKKNDEVLIIAGKFKGTTGRVLKVDKKKNKVTVDKVNVVKKHVKPTQQNPEGGIQEFEAPIHISNVKYTDRSAKKAKIKEIKKNAVAASKKEDAKPVKEVKAEVKPEAKVVEAAAKKAVANPVEAKEVKTAEVKEGGENDSVAK